MDHKLLLYMHLTRKLLIHILLTFDKEMFYAHKCTVIMNVFVIFEKWSVHFHGMCRTIGTSKIST
jgi:hypothetical protein